MFGGLGGLAFDEQEQSREDLGFNRIGGLQLRDEWTRFCIAALGVGECEDDVFNQIVGLFGLRFPGGDNRGQIVLIIVLHGLSTQSALAADDRKDEGWVA